MRILFLSNYYTHHQEPLCEALDRLTEHRFSFVETEPFSEERKRLGWKAQTGVPFVQQYGELCRDGGDPVLEADAVILGSAPLALVRRRLRARKLTFLYAERIYKNGYEPLKWLPRVFRFWARYGRYPSLYLLAASGYAVGDYVRHGTFRGKCCRWGYFPETKTYDLFAQIAAKEPRKILWCGRFLDWKHPEAALETAKRLKDQGLPFELELIGAGPMEEELKRQARAMDLEDRVRFLGVMDAETVRTHMESAGIFLFTSDFHEGWGAVVNEAMNSGCAVVTSHAAGSVPFLLKQGENGLIYRSGDIDGLYGHVRSLLERPERQRELGAKAYETIKNLWNADCAAGRLLTLSEAIRRGTDWDLYRDGPCSRAPVLWNHWFPGEKLGRS